MQLVDTLVPLKRPHFHLVGKQLFFLISKRPYLELDACGAELWQRIDGVTTVGRLREHFRDANERIGEFRERGLLELAQSELKNRRRVLVIEPHMDDAILSVGGMMWQRRDECEFTVLSVIDQSNFTSYHRIDRDYFDVRIVSELRRAESETVMRVLGGTHRVLDIHDAPLRYQPGKWTRAWYVRNWRAVTAFVKHSSTDAEVESLVKSVLPVLSSTDAQEIWIPLGVGASADHEMTRNACLWALMRSPAVAQRTEMYFYQDVPYALEAPKHTAQIIGEFVSLGGSVEAACSDITAVMPDKLRLLSVFGSQFKPSYMDPKVRAAARQAMSSTARFGELRFRIDRLPDRADQMSFYSGQEHIQTLLARLRDWYPRNRAAKRVRILCPMGIGRWQEDMAFLLEAFPQAVLEVHLTADNVDEAMRLTSPRIEIRPVDGLGWAWIFRILRVIFSRPWPLIVSTSVKLHRLRPLIRWCVFADPLPTTTIDHLVQALRIRISEFPLRAGRS